MCQQVELENQVKACERGTTHEHQCDASANDSPLVQPFDSSQSAWRQAWAVKQSCANYNRRAATLRSFGYFQCCQRAGQCGSAILQFASRRGRATNEAKRSGAGQLGCLWQVAIFSASELSPLQARTSTPFPHHPSFPRSGLRRQACPEESMRRHWPAWPGWWLMLCRHQGTGWTTRS